jgi:hypothetical protein
MRLSRTLWKSGCVSSSAVAVALEPTVDWATCCGAEPLGQWLVYSWPQRLAQQELLASDNGVAEQFSCRHFQLPTAGANACRSVDLRSSNHSPGWASMLGKCI